MFTSTLYLPQQTYRNSPGRSCGDHRGHLVAIDDLQFDGLADHFGLAYCIDRGGDPGQFCSIAGGVANCDDQNL